MRSVVWAGLLGAWAWITVGCGLNEDDPYRELPVVSLQEAPAPIAGGTLLVTQDGRWAVASDPDRHRIAIVDLSDRGVGAIALARGAEPGRLVEDGAGRVYVALRSGGAVVALDPAAATLGERYDVCAHPRGLAWQSEGDLLHVACADGTLATLGPDRTLARVLRLQPDLRDVVVSGGGLLVSRFRSAELLRVGRESARGAASGPWLTQLRSRDGALVQEFAPRVATRLAVAGEGAVLLHQHARVGPDASPSPSSAYSTGADASPESWRDPCDNGVVHATLTFTDPHGTPMRSRRAPPVRRGVTPVDVAVSAGGRIAIAFAGEPTGSYALGAQVVSSHLGDFGWHPRGCLEGNGVSYPGQVVAVAFAGERELVQLREPARLVIDREIVVELGGESVRDTGHDIFHHDLGGGISCATCHPGGGDDGHVWEVEHGRPIRTQPLEGMIAFPPYHRAGDIRSFERLMTGLSAQMGAPTFDAPVLDALERWLERLPPAPAGPRSEPETIARGAAEFEALGCASCHAGELGTDGSLHRVGDRWKTPPLQGVALRAPFFHDGRAASLSEVLRDPAHSALSPPPSAVLDLEHYLLSR